MPCYRVWMKDGYACLQDEPTEAEALAKAIALAKKNIHGCAMSVSEKRAAVTVDYVDNLDAPRPATKPFKLDW